jgi:hypothetical protein
VNSHGGRLWAEPRSEGGAAFYLALPLATEVAAIDVPHTMIGKGATPGIGAAPAHAARAWVAENPT